MKCLLFGLTLSSCLAQVAVLGPPRRASVAQAKYTLWMTERREIEAVKPAEASEVGCATRTGSALSLSDKGFAGKGSALKPAVSDISLSSYCFGRLFFVIMRVG